MEGYYYDEQQVVMQEGIIGQWSFQETKELMRIRAELDRSFMETKRNKVLWEMVSSRMLQKGFSRTSHQCKSKWKNLLTRYKGCSAMEVEEMRQQFPFYNEFHAIFCARMQSMIWVEEDDENEEQQQQEDKTRTTDKAGPSSIKKRKTMNKGSSSNITSSSGLKEMLDEFKKQEEAMEVKWKKARERREEETRQRENEWRKKMTELEEERAVVEMRWTEMEEQRRLRDEPRAYKRDALVNALLSKLNATPDYL